MISRILACLISKTANPALSLLEGDVRAYSWVNRVADARTTRTSRCIGP